MSFCPTRRLAASLAVLLTALSATAWGITIRPAPFDHYEVTVPENIQAGEEFFVPVSFLDRYGNEMPAGWQPESPMTLSLTPPATLVSPSSLTRDNYAPGFGFRVRSDSAGKVVMKLLDGTGRETRSWTLSVKAGRPARLEVVGPAEAVAGEPSVLRVRAFDRFGNFLPGYEAGEYLGEGPLQVEKGDVRRLSDGTVEVPVRFTAAGEVPLRLSDRSVGLTASGSTVRVKAAPLARFAVEPGSSRTAAGRSFGITLKALDSLGNTVVSYGREYRGVRITSSTGAVVPDLVAPGDFVDGVAKVPIVLRAAGRHNIQFKELQGAAWGEAQVEVDPGAVQTVEVITPDSAVAGEPFEIVLTAQDEFGNRVPALPEGSTVHIRTTGEGAVVPDVVPASAYRQGEARLKVRVEKAGAFTLSAAMSGGVSAPAPSPRAPAAAPSPAAEAKPPAPKAPSADPARLAAEKAREEALRARRESRLQEKRVSEKVQSAPPTAMAPAAVKAAPATKAPAPKAPAPQPAAPRPPEPAQPQARQALQPAAPAPARSKASPPRPGYLDEITVTEEADRALITFDTNGLTDYTVSTSAKLSRKWIDVHFPALKPDLPDRIKGGKSVVGEVYVDMAGGGLTVSVEILPVRIGYDIYHDGPTLVLKVLRQ